MDEPFDEELQGEQPVAVQPARLSTCARQALERAADEARRFGDPYVGTDHVLLALCGFEAAAAARVFAELEVDGELLAARMAFIRGRAVTSDNGEIAMGQSPRLQRVLATAAKDAAKRGHTEIGTLHLLAGLLREKEGLAVFLLEFPGVGLERAGGAIARAHRDGLRDA